jgi:CxxC motif-containing protein (DUF1111 family)
MANAASAADVLSKAQLEKGKELFVREWIPDDPRSHGGDGLGPVYNDTSCVACHNAGAPGGGGPNSKNVDIVSAFPMQNQMVVVQAPGFFKRALSALLGIEQPAPQAAKPGKIDTAPLIKAHAGFKTSRSVVLHRFASDPKYDAWRISLVGMGQFAEFPAAVQLTAEQRGQMELQQTKFRMQMAGNMNQMQGQAGQFTLTVSQRNPTALFGAGLIDSIPDDVLVAASKAKYRDFPEVVGRVSRLKNGKIGRFGWKAQTPSLEDFVLTACAVELGLEVPGHPQGGLPQSPEAKAKGLDLTGEECAALTAFVRALPKPLARKASSDVEAAEIAAGKTLFANAGCATCHTPKLGEVDGLYSDLLLHDMGPELADTGQYGVFVPDSSDPEFVDPDQPAEPGPIAEAAPFSPSPFVTPAPPPSPPPVLSDVTDAQAVVVTRAIPQAAAHQAIAAPAKPATGPATRQEWRTPPLWGFRDSGPYLHDGRAQTLNEAVAMHGGRGERSAQKYFTLSHRERLQVQTFLKSLVAPAESLRVARASE